MLFLGNHPPTKCRIGATVGKALDRGKKKLEIDANQLKRYLNLLHNSTDAYFTTSCIRSEEHAPRFPFLID